MGSREHAALGLLGAALCITLFCSASQQHQDWSKPRGSALKPLTQNDYCGRLVTWPGGNDSGLAGGRWLQSPATVSRRYQGRAEDSGATPLRVVPAGREKHVCGLPLPMGKYLECPQANGPMPKSSPETDSQPTSAICRKTKVSGKDR